MTRIGVIGAGITGVTTAYALCRARLRRHGLRSASLCRQWRPRSRTAASSPQAMPRSGTRPSTVWQGTALDVEARCAASHESDAGLAQVFVDGGVRAQYPELPAEYDRDGAARDRGPPAYVRDGGAGEHRLRSRALRNPAFLPRQGQLREGGEGERAADRRRPRTAAGDPRGDPSDRAHAEGIYYGGFFTPSDSTGDIHKFTRGLADACARRGVRFVYDAEVENIVPKSGGFEIAGCPWRPTMTDEAARTSGVRSRSTGS